MNDLRLWSLSTFRVTSFMIAVVTWQHVAGSLPQRFSRLGTGIGLILFAGLWACTWLATRWGLRTQADARIAPAAWGPPITPTVIAGGWNGLLLFVPLIVTVVAGVLTEGRMVEQNFQAFERRAADADSLAAW